MTSGIRTGLLSAAALAVSATAATSIGVYDGGGGRDRVAAVRHIKSALDALDAPGPDPTTAIAHYRGELVEAQRLLRRSVLAYPVDTASIQRLAAVLWELTSSAGENDQKSISDLVQLAAARTPKLPETQIELGELLYRVGRGPEAAQRFADALALEPKLARRVVELMLALGSSPSEIASVLSPSPELLTSLEASFLQAGLDAEFTALVDESLDSWPEELLPMFGDLCLRGGHAANLLTRLARPFETPSQRVESLRLLQRSRALVTLGERQAAFAEARKARTLAPQEPVILEAIGEIAIEGGDATMALEALHDALTLLTQTQPSPLTIGRVYRRIGQAEELAGEPEKAVDAYTRATRLNPNETYARARVAEMEAAAGLRP